MAENLNKGFKEHTSETKVIILYRVIQNWRAPIFEKLAKKDGIKLEIWYGPDFKGTKVISTKKNFSFKKQKMFSFKIKLSSKNGIIAMPFSPFLFFKLIINNPDVVISEGASNLVNSLQAFVYCKIFNKKYIWWSLGKLLNREYDKKRIIIDKLIQYVEKNATSIISYSSRGKDYFGSVGVEEKNIFVAVNVVDTSTILKKISEKKDIKELYNHYHTIYDFVVIFVGALIKEKDIHKLLYSQKIIEHKNNNIGLLIIGEGNYANSLRGLSNELGLKNVEFLGSKTDDNYKYFAAADLFVLPGLGGLAISEAMCYGLPVISSTGDGCEVDLVGSNGVIDNELTAESLSRYIIEFYKNPVKAKKAGAESLRIIREGKNVENYLKTIIDAINN